MSLQRRLLLYLTICAPIVWAVAMTITVGRARHQVDELYDTELIRLARQIQVMLPPGELDSMAELPPVPFEGATDAGESDVRDLAVAVWNAKGRLLLADREGAQLPRHPDASGFTDEQVAGRLWRIYWLQSFDGDFVVAAGQGAYERDELVWGLTLSQVVPWLFVLPVLLAVMAWAVRRALLPMRSVTAELQSRKANDLQPLADQRAPSELQPMLRAMNELFARIDQMIVRERRFTADAAHELRTPLAILRAQWDVVRRSASVDERAEAESKLGAGFDRMSRLVTQMLALSRVESSASSPVKSDLDWPPIVEQAVSDCLELANRRDIELACEWPTEGAAPLPILGDEHLMAILLRNLLDNAVRYAPAGTRVTLRVEADRLEVDNDGEPLSIEQLARLGERFHRPDGQQESGSGLGVSIVLRIAELHGLDVRFGTAAAGSGVRVTLTPLTPPRAARTLSPVVSSRAAPAPPRDDRYPPPDGRPAPEQPASARDS